MKRLLFFLIFAASVSVPAQSISARRVFEQAMKEAKTGRYERALENYRKTQLLSESDPLKEKFLAKIRFNIGVCLYHLQKPAEAAEEFRQAIRLTRNTYQKAFYALGMAETAMKNWRKAIDGFRTAVDLKKDDAEAWFDLALALLEEKDFGSAETAFRQAIKYKSAATPDAHNNIGALLVIKGDFESAEKEFKTALLKSGGKSAEATNNLRLCEYYKQNAARVPPANFALGKGTQNQGN